MRLERIPVESVYPDPDVQHEWSYNEKLAQKIAANFHEEAAGVIHVAKNGRDGFACFIGRHRARAAGIAGRSTIRAFVHPPSITVEEKFRIKRLGETRRIYRRIEDFLDAVGEGNPDAVRVNNMAAEYGFHFGKLGGGKPYDRIEAIGAVLKQDRVGSDRLPRTFALMTLWQGEPKVTHNQWIAGCGEFVARDYDAGLTATQYKLLKAAIPGEILRRAMGESRGYGGAGGEIAGLIAEALRKRARVRRRRNPA